MLYFLFTHSLILSFAIAFFLSIGSSVLSLILQKKLERSELGVRPRKRFGLVISVFFLLCGVVLFICSIVLPFLWYRSLFAHWVFGFLAGTVFITLLCTWFAYRIVGNAFNSVMHLS